MRPVLPRSRRLRLLAAATTAGLAAALAIAVAPAEEPAATDGSETVAERSRAAAPPAAMRAPGHRGPATARHPVPPAPTVREIWRTVRQRTPAPVAYADRPPRDIDCGRVKCLALTFDDGPGPDTDRLLEMLAGAGARATFFVLGRNVAADPATVARAAWDGHEIGIHTWDHTVLPGRSAADLAADILRTADEVTRVSGVRPRLVRPPHGRMDAWTTHLVRRPIVLWSVDSEDWRNPNEPGHTERVVRKVTRSARPGSVVLMHDVHRSPVQAVPAILEHFAVRGYTFVTVSELFGERLRPGTEYRGEETEARSSQRRRSDAGR